MVLLLLCRHYIRNKLILVIKRAMSTKFTIPGNSKSGAAFSTGLSISCLGALLVLTALVGGCSTAPTKPVAKTHLVWPAPPQEARIRFVRSIYGDDVFNHKPTFSENLHDFLAGEKPKTTDLVQPMGLAVSDDGERLYVSDFAQGAVFEFDFAHQHFSKIGPLAEPVGLALDGQENLYVVEQAKKGVTVFDRSGKALRFITDPSLKRPTGIAIDRQRGKIYVVDTSHTKSPDHSVKIFNLDGKFLGKLGKGKGGGPGEFMFPTYVTLDHKGDVYVTDTLNSRVEMFDPDGKYLRSFGRRGNGWGMFDKPKGVALDSFGNLYVADSGWSNVQIFNSKGQILLFFGGRGPIPGMLKNPTAVAISRHNNIYVADYINHRIEEYELVNTKAADSYISTADSGKQNVAKH